MCSIVVPKEADSPLIVDADRPLACAVASQFLKPIARHPRQVAKRLGRIDCPQFALCWRNKLRRKISRSISGEENRAASFLEAADWH